MRCLINDGSTVIVDSQDEHIISNGNWYVNAKGYIISSKAERLHRIILEVNDPNIQVDHINHDKSDNRRCNLRLCSNQQNHCNKPKQNGAKFTYKGVDLLPSGNWRAYITVNEKTIHIGVFKTEEDAAKAYNRKAKALFKEFACLNNVEGWQEFDIRSSRVNKACLLPGIVYDKSCNRFLARPRIEGKYIYIGKFRNEFEASLALLNWVVDNDKVEAFKKLQELDVALIAIFPKDRDARREMLQKYFDVHYLAYKLNGNDINEELEEDMEND